MDNLLRILKFFSVRLQVHNKFQLVENFHAIKVRKEKKMTTSHLRAIPSGVQGSIKVSESQVAISDVVIDNAELATYLKTFETQELQVWAFIDLVNYALYVKKLAGSTLETENVRKSAEMAVQKLDGTVASVMQTIETSTNKLIHPETGVIAQKLKQFVELLNADSTQSLKTMLSPQDAATPLGQLLNSLTTALNTHVNGLKTDIDSVKEILDRYIGAQEKKKDLYANSREKGGDLEEILDVIVQREAAAHGDDARYTGDTAAPSGKNVGDEVVTLKLADTSNVSVKFVWEAKTDKTFKDAKGRLKRDKVANELNDAISNRDAVCGIFVSDARGLDPDLQPDWQEFEGNKLVIVLDTDNPQERLVRLAYLWARSYALRVSAPADVEFDVEEIERVINNLQREFGTLKQLKDAHTPIQTNIVKAQKYVEEFEESIDKMLKDLRKLMTPNKESD